jgi:hypothetical protein
VGDRDELVRAIAFGNDALNRSAETRRRVMQCGIQIVELGRTTWLESLPGAQLIALAHSALALFRRAGSLPSGFQGAIAKALALELHRRAPSEAEDGRAFRHLERLLDEFAS